MTDSEETSAKSDVSGLFWVFWAITGLQTWAGEKKSHISGCEIVVAYAPLLEYLCRPSQTEGKIEIKLLKDWAISSGVERHVDIVEVGGSRPPSPTNPY